MTVRPGRTAAAADRLDGAMDRLEEAHFFLHQVEAYYHFAAPFRWHLNAFLRALKEVPQLVRMALQQAPGFKVWYQPLWAALAADPLVHDLAKQRDFVVHQGMLVPGSSAALGVADYGGMRLGVGVPVSPLVDSDAAMEQFLRTTRATGDPFGILVEDEDTLPCVERRWALAAFPGEDVLDVCARGWLRMAELVGAVYGWAGIPLEPPALPCRHDSARVRLRFYERDALARGEVSGHGIPPTTAGAG